jgi:hypothetical protein
MSSSDKKQANFLFQKLRENNSQNEIPHAELQGKCKLSRLKINVLGKGKTDNAESGCESSRAHLAFNLCKQNEIE